MNKTTALKAMPFFQGLDEEQLNRLTLIARTRTFAKGDLLFSAHEQADGFYSPVEGRVKVFRTSPAGKEQILHVFGPGELVGEVPVFEGGTFPASCQAVDKCRTLFFPRDGFREVLGEDPDLAMRMMALLSQRLRGLVAKIDDLSLKETPARVADYLLRLKKAQDAETLRLELPKGQVALYLGTVQETLSRILKRFSEQGLISLNGREIRVLDQDGLEDVANQGR